MTLASLCREEGPDLRLIGLYFSLTVIVTSVTLTPKGWVYPREIQDTLR
jgi:hypothetical protein